MSDVTPIRSSAAAAKQELEDISREVAEALQRSLPEDCKFALFIYRPDGSTKYISSGEAQDIDLIVDRWRARVFGGPVATDPSRNAPAELRRLRDHMLAYEHPTCPNDTAGLVECVISRLRELRSALHATRTETPGLPRPGDRRYSKYFRANIELVSYTDDKHWTFHVDGAPAGHFLPNQTPWSKMPPAKES